MSKENLILDFRLMKIDETKSYMLEKINYNVLMSKKH